MHLVDQSTFLYAKQRYPDIIGWVPQLHAEDGRPHFNTTKFVCSDGSFVSVFAVKPVYYEALGGFWRPLSEITKYHGNKRIELNENWRLATPRFIDWLQKRQALLGSELLLPTPFGHLLSQDIARPKVYLGLTTTTVYPDPDPETTTIDGYVQQYNGGTSNTWATFRDGSGSSATDNATTANPIIQSGTTSTNFRAMGRTIYLFDTSAISTDTISSTILSLYITATNNAGGFATSYLDMYTVSSAPASNTSLVAADYTTLGTTNYASIGFTSFTTSAYNDFTFSDFTLISKTGITKLGQRFKADADDTDPSPGASGIGNTTVTNYMAEQADVTTDPKLVIVHAAASTFTPKVMFF